MFEPRFAHNEGWNYVLHSLAHNLNYSMWICVSEWLPKLRRITRRLKMATGCYCVAVRFYLVQKLSRPEWLNAAADQAGQLNQLTLEDQKVAKLKRNFSLPFPGDKRIEGKRTNANGLWVAFKNGKIHLLYWIRVSSSVDSREQTLWDREAITAGLLPCHGRWEVTRPQFWTLWKNATFVQWKSFSWFEINLVTLTDRRLGSQLSVWPCALSELPNMNAGPKLWARVDCNTFLSPIVYKNNCNVFNF